MGVKDVMLDIPLTAIIALIVLVILLAVFFMMKGGIPKEGLAEDIAESREDNLVFPLPYLMFLIFVLLFFIVNRVYPFCNWWNYKAISLFYLYQ